MTETTATSTDIEVEALRRDVARLNKVVASLMNRAERSLSFDGSDFSHFQTAVVLQQQIRARTRDLEAALRDNEKITRDLKAANEQILQSEKLASIGQLAAGVAHEINNPISFVYTNLGSLRGYVADLLAVLDTYALADPLLAADPEVQARIAAVKKATDLEYVRQDIETLVAESIDGAERVRRIVQDLRDFSRAGTNDWHLADLHAALDSTLTVVRNEIKYKAEVVKCYGELPPVECVVTQLNQVFLNLLLNAAQAIAERGVILLTSGCTGDEVWIAIADTGNGIPPENLSRIFDPFFTTKPAGVGTGLGLSVSYGIVDRHGGRIDVASKVGEGTTFTIHLPVRRA
jgi:two-component system, NtrC family, sensor kinase